MWPLECRFVSHLLTNTARTTLFDPIMVRDTGHAYKMLVEKAIVVRQTLNICYDDEDYSLIWLGEMGITLFDKEVDGRPFPSRASDDYRPKPSRKELQFGFNPTGGLNKHGRTDDWAQSQTDLLDSAKVAEVEKAVKG